jgi:cobalt/nickel transport system permease protein
MGIVGPFTAYAIWKISSKINIPKPVGVFLAVAVGNLITYVVTSIQLALAFPLPSFSEAFLKFGSVFAITQIPLSIGEGILAVIFFDFLLKNKSQILTKLKVIKLPNAKHKEEN